MNRSVVYGNRIRKIRKAKGITSCYVAKKLGMSPGGYSDIERGRRKLSAERVEKIAKILEIDIGEIFYSSKRNA
ncbi:transcriptional regulator, XRE family [Desulfofarcimen acetoxidans DSM 771]|uniref:Transcriptional regulator, XRE family n=1 Tax=Desulfofarcimen acetoxidans (strain ATCC 49208 / DSM 771 / KCTC 5769 / VKM B-1644 / 5575) TaxID=485916 RepID=C8W0I7_DESAS|nr:helix-turn-helix transcriptional regulator [Desulfofarcimen acetoxidans]ACV63242.1 transcriptional regulator, XRE family [Desulfofarcimen acetoxidans DSM 771]